MNTYLLESGNVVLICGHVHQFLLEALDCLFKLVKIDALIVVSHP